MSSASGFFYSNEDWDRVSEIDAEQDLFSDCKKMTAQMEAMESDLEKLRSDMEESRSDREILMYDHEKSKADLKALRDRLDRDIKRMGFESMEQMMEAHKDNPLRPWIVPVEPASLGARVEAYYETNTVATTFRSCIEHSPYLRSLPEEVVSSIINEVFELEYESRLIQWNRELLCVRSDCPCYDPRYDARSNEADLTPAERLVLPEVWKGNEHVLCDFRKGEFYRKMEQVRQKFRVCDDCN